MIEIIINDQLLTLIYGPNARKDCGMKRRKTTQRLTVQSLHRLRARPNLNC